MAEQPKRVPAHKIIEYAGAARVDPRTMRKALEGKPVRGFTGDRINDELKRRGLR